MSPRCVPPVDPRRRRLLALLALAALPAVRLPSARAADPARLSPDDVAAHLSRAGYSAVSRLRQRGDVFTADAVSRNGLAVHVVVNAATGAIVGLRYIDRTLTAAPPDAVGR